MVCFLAASLFASFGCVLMSNCDVTPLDWPGELFEWTPPNRTKEFEDARVPLINYEDDKGPKILVCHDMAGGYLPHERFDGANVSEDAPFVFVHWWNIDVYCYFSHHFITIPPMAITRVAHRHGVRVLGTFITEWTPGEGKCAELLATEESISLTVYKMVEIMEFYGFDGWLINVENVIKPEQIVPLVYFVSLLRERCQALNAKNLVIWYDSVLKNGKLRWQNTLNALNRIFYDSSDGIFLNYNWTREHLRRSFLEATGLEAQIPPNPDAQKSVCTSLPDMEPEQKKEEEPIEKKKEGDKKEESKEEKKEEEKNKEEPKEEKKEEEKKEEEKFDEDEIREKEFMKEMVEKAKEKKEWKDREGVVKSVSAKASTIWVGIDVFARSCVGGWESRKSFEEIALFGMSAALFAPGWIIQKFPDADPMLQTVKFWNLLRGLTKHRKVTRLPISTRFSAGFFGEDHSRFSYSHMDLHPDYLSLNGTPTVGGLLLLNGTHRLFNMEVDIADGCVLCLHSSSRSAPKVLVNSTELVLVDEEREERGRAGRGSSEVLKEVNLFDANGDFDKTTVEEVVKQHLTMTVRKAKYTVPKGRAGNVTIVIEDPTALITFFSML